jgi:hypothetical protein
MSIDEYIDQELSGKEPTLDDIKECLKQYTYLVSKITDADKIEMYERYIDDIATNYVLGYTETFTKLLDNAVNWRDCRSGETIIGFEKQRIEQTKTFLNLRKTF